MPAKLNGLVAQHPSLIDAFFGQAKHKASAPGHFNDPSIIGLLPTIEFGGHSVTLLEGRSQALTPFGTVLARHIRVTDTNADESVFLEEAARGLNRLDITPTKMLCGRIHRFTLPTGSMLTRSLLIADLRLKDSALVQHHGLGSDRLLGCGLFLPHKSIDAVHSPLDDEGN